MSFQNLISSQSSLLESLHDLIMIWLTVITIVVLLVGAMIFYNFGVFSLTLESTFLEIIWTVVPMFILTSIAVPSVALLCQQDTFVKTSYITLKLISNQWNWQSSVDNYQVDHLLDSLKLDELSGFSTPLMLALGKTTRIMLTSSDVLHSLGLPSMGVKVDSSPGRINSVVIEPANFGLLTGSCYELCGSGHSAMPIFFFIS